MGALVAPSAGAQLDVTRVVGADLLEGPWNALKNTSDLVPDSFSGGTYFLSEVCASRTFCLNKVATAHNVPTTVARECSCECWIGGSTPCIWL